MSDGHKEQSISDRIRYWAQQTPDAPALLSAEMKPLTYAALAAQCAAIHDTLQGCGIGAGTRVAIVHSGGAEMAATIAGVWSAAVAAPLNPNYKVGELLIHLRDRAVQAAIVEAGLASPAVIAADELGLPTFEVAADDPLVAGSVTLTALNATKVAVNVADTREVTADDLIVVLATSGTTSSYKVVPIRHRQMATRASQVVRALGITSQDRGINLMPLHHVGGLSAGLSTSFYSGSAACSQRSNDFDQFFQGLQSLRPSYIAAAFTVFHSILEQAPKYPEAIAAIKPGLRMLRTGAGHLDRTIASRLEEIFEVPVVQAYGSTETGFMTCTPLQPLENKRGSVGVTCGSEIAILDSDGNTLPADTQGDVAIRGPGVFDGYEGDAQANADAFAGDWYRTGDSGYLDRDEYLFLTGRTKDLINRGGEKIPPSEVDAVLFSHPGVVEAATFPVPHRTLGEEVAAAVVLARNSHATRKDIVAHARERLSPSKVPRVVVIVDQIPKSANGKIVRRHLARQVGLVSPGGAKAGGLQQSETPRGGMETRLAEMWCRVLKREYVGRHDNFFLLGGDSLQAVELFLEIENEMGRRLPRTILFEAGSIAEMAQMMGVPAERSCIIPIKPEGTRPAFFCVHGLDGGVITFRQLAEQMGPEQPFYGIQSPSLNSQSLSIDSMEDMAEHYVSQLQQIQPKGPYYIGGYSMGGRIALAMAQHLIAEGEQVELLALLDTHSWIGRHRLPLRDRLKRNMQKLSSANNSRRVAVLKSKLARDANNTYARFSRYYDTLLLSWYRKSGKPLPQHSRLTRFINSRINQSYKPSSYSGKTVLIKVENPLLHSDVHRGWEQVFNGPYETHTVGGDHLNMLEEPHAADVARLLVRHLQREC